MNQKSYNLKIIDPDVKYTLYRKFKDIEIHDEEVKIIEMNIDTFNAIRKTFFIITPCAPICKKFFGDNFVGTIWNAHVKTMDYPFGFVKLIGSKRNIIEFYFQIQKSFPSRLLGYQIRYLEI